MGNRNDVYSRPTKRGYDFGQVGSALQKSIRRGDARSAGYWALELVESRFGPYMWRRLLIITAEDCHQMITKEIKALYDSWEVVRKVRPASGKVFVAKAVILMSQALKSRDADHLVSLVYDRKYGLTDEELTAQLDEARSDPIPIPDEALDVHTREGKSRGRTKQRFMTDEFDGLKPRQKGLFDEDLERVRKTTPREYDAQKKRLSTHDREKW